MSKRLRMVDIIAHKKDGKEHLEEEIKFLVDGVKNKTIPDYQLSAWLMAVNIQGMSKKESAILTHEIAKSGEILDLSAIGDYIIDKHSTGGVGDKTTIILIPLLAAAGVPVAKLSGRGLGHTGGTIDKLESIPGFNTALNIDDFITTVKTHKCAIASQTSNLAPVDGILYALRDVTATVASIPLIASSVISKKIASGANVIVLDVKCGNGAFMKSVDDARVLSQTMVDIGQYLNRSIVSVITGMEQPLGNAVGNNLEVIESIETLKNKGPKDLTELCLYLGAISLVKANKVTTIREGKDVLAELLNNGKAFEQFKVMVKNQGGDVSYIDNPDKFPASKYKLKLNASKNGFIQEINAMEVGKLCKILGAGRETKEDPIDHAVGIVLNKKIGDEVEVNDLIATIHANAKEEGEATLELFSQSVIYSEFKITAPELIIDTIDH